MDILITRESDPIIKMSPSSDLFLSDHCTVLCELSILKPPLKEKNISYRKLKTIDIQQFKHDLKLSQLCQDSVLENFDVNSLTTLYNSTLIAILDKHAPLRHKSITVHQRVPWFNYEIKEAKRKRRKLERKWRSSGLETDRLQFTSMRNKTTRLMETARREFYTDFINENCADQRKLFKAANQLLGRHDDVTFPPHSDPANLANQFGMFFAKKITDIRKQLEKNETAGGMDNISSVEPALACSFDEFHVVSTDSVKKLVTSSSNKSCPSDPIPTSIVKTCIDELLPIITTIINRSLKDGCFPDEWKGALVVPKLKKPDAELVHKNFRPISNLPFLSKLTEKVVAQEMVSHMSIHCLFPVFQSAYRQAHSTETALLRVRNDILMNMNKQHVTLLVLLDLSAAFDTIDHDVLIRRLQSSFGISGNALAWFHSYLSDRFQRVIIENVCSNKFELKHGVPQGSCLGPLLFSIYTSHLFEIVGRHLPQVHCYADDTQIYLAFKPDNSASQTTAISTMEACIDDLRRWMIEDKLMINDDKTEFILIGTKQQLEKVKIQKLSVGQCEITPSSVVRNLGSWFDSNFSMAVHVNKVCKSSFYHLHNLSRIRKYLSQDTLETLVHAFITSRLDQCNALLYGLPKLQLHKLQRVQNAAARLVLRSSKFCRITPCLFELHWLPIKFRIDFKIILLAFKTIHGLAPKYLCDLVIVKPQSKYSLRSNNELLLKPPDDKTLVTLGDRAFSAAAPKLWNLLPRELRDIQSLSKFKKELKTYLFRIAFSLA